MVTIFRCLHQQDAQVSVKCDKRDVAENCCANTSLMTLKRVEKLDFIWSDMERTQMKSLRNSLTFP